MRSSQPGAKLADEVGRITLLLHALATNCLFAEADDGPATPRAPSRRGSSQG